jgi:hypothetical protein
VLREENSVAKAISLVLSVSALQTISEAIDMLLKLTVSARDIIVMAKVAFNRGSSQQGNARRAAVGFHK